LLFILLARELNVNFYGELRATFVFLNILLMALELGFANYIQRETASNNKNLENELNTTLTVKLLLFFFFFIIVLIYSRTYSWINIAQIIILIFAFYLSSANNLLSRLFYGKDNYSQVFKLFFAARFLFILDILKGFFFGFSLTEIFSILLISNLIIVILFVYLCNRENIQIKVIGIDLNLLKKILRSSLPIGIGIFFVWIYDRIDVLLIQGYLGDSSVSFYTIAYSFYKVPQIFSGILLIPLFTELSKEQALKKRISMNSILTPIIILAIISIFTIVISLLVSDKIIPLLYTRKYFDSVVILNLLIFALPGLLLNNTTGVILNSCKREKIPMYATFIGLIINITINIIFIERFNLIAPVIATIVTEYMILIIQAAFIIKYKLVDFSKTLNYNI